MAMIINTNIASLNAQRNLTMTQNDLQVSLQRLSTGLRINSAKDDAAGLAISERFTTQIRGLNQAARNANDGISLAQTAESALGEVTNNLQRIRELAVQARNATNSDSDRQALDAEVQQRINEINRVANQTEFNGLRILDGSFTEQVFQVGANFGQTISVSSIASTTAAALGLTGGTLTSTEATVTGGAITGDLTDGNLTINGTNIGAPSGDAAEISLAINTLVSDVTATATDASSGSLGAFTQVTGTTAGGATYTLNVGGVDVVAAVDPEVTTIDGAYIDTQLAGAAGTALNNAGITWTGTAAGGDLDFTLAGGANLDITETHAGDAAQGFTTTVNGGTQTSRGTVDLSSENDIVIAGTDPSVAGFTAGTTTAIETTETYTAINVLTADDADTVLRVVDESLTTVNSSRADLGAVQNRFESVVTSLSSIAESMTAARSRIMDADFAAETASLTRSQILQQAGVAILAQANSLPQLALSLLQ